jgi:hypothetical protein
MTEMGLARANGRKANLTDRLRELAGELEPVKMPWFVNQPAYRSRTPSQGWWWIPGGQEYPVFLGHNHITAEVQLQTLLDGQELPK